MFIFSNEKNYNIARVYREKVITYIQQGESTKKPLVFIEKEFDSNEPMLIKFLQLINRLYSEATNLL